MIPQETVNQILDAAHIEDVVSDFVTLKRRGASFVACCPFHNEKTPSFYVTPSKGIYKCFGCGKAGNAVGFLMEHEHIGYVEALKYLAAKYHIEVIEKEETPEEIAARQHSESLMLVSEFAQRFFVSNMDTTEGRAVARAYCNSRGLDESTVAKFGIGWASSGRTALTDAALAAGFKAEYLIDANLSVRYEDGRLVDRFHERLMFPIHSLSGRVVAFSGRTLKSDGSVAKYVNSSETEIYVKGKSLFGIALSKTEIARQNRCYLAEGNVDVVSMHQLGICNVIASCGTALTEGQVRIIKRFTDNVTVMYDGDAAGIKAALKAIALLLKEDLNVKVLLFPDGDDPDSFCRKHTLQEVQDFIASNEQDFLDYMADRVPDADKRDPVRRSSLIADVSDTIAQIPDPIKRSVYIETASSRFGIGASLLAERIQTKRRAMRSEELVRAERAQRRQTAQLPPMPEDVPYYDSVPQMSDTVENAIVGKAEKDLLYFVLTHGRDVLDFDVDSDFYSSESDKPVVAEFIRASIEADGDGFYNTVYRRAYDTYMRLFDRNMEQSEIIRSLLNGEDRQTAEITAELSIEKYEITVDNFKKAMTTTSSWLAAYVPKAILYYTDRKIEDKLVNLRNRLQSADAVGQTDILAKIVKLQAAQKTVKIKLGREKIK